MSTLIGPPRIRNLPVDITTVTGNYSITLDDYFLAVLNTNSPWTLTLPLSADIPNGKTFIVKDESGGAGANNITVQATAPETIDGQASKVINGNRGSVTVLARQNGYSLI